MTAKAIEVENLGKRYKIGRRMPYLALRDVMASALSAPFKRDKGPAALTSTRGWFWALRNLEFDVPQGEIIGVIGRNGAGKSTLLKILTRITQPTEGNAVVRGRIGSLLEVGTGFHPELTGRENIYFNGVILGMSKKDIDRRFDDIVDFAETNRFVDTVVKHYSSGMQVRLAFSVAAHLEPEIMLVDEVLTVGDLNFQKKCLDRMAEVARGGRTVLLVSHQMNQIRRLCNSAIWLDDGNIRLKGPTAEVIARYEKDSLEERSEGDNDQSSKTFLRWMLSGNQADSHVLDHSGPVTIAFDCRVNQTIHHGHQGIALYDSQGQLMWGAASDDISLEPGLHRTSFTLPYLPLKPGPYRWKVSLWDMDSQIDLWDAVPELVIGTKPLAHLSDEWSGILNIPARFEVQRR